METDESPTERSQRIRQAMQAHVAARLARALDKFKGKDDTAARKGMADAREKYQMLRLLEKGAKANAMAVATHIAKGVHPDLKIKSNTNLNVRFDELFSLDEVGSHVLRSQLSLADTTGDGAYNAAAYELYLLLQCRVDGATLAQLLQSGDPDAAHALTPETTDAAKFAEELLSLLETKCAKPAVHTLGKQLYWLTGDDPSIDGDYHLISPLYPASLVHQAYLQIHPTRYGEASTAARKAKREGKAHDGVYQEYRNWGVQKMGGTKPQNISHLNSERRGENYLLASLPPSGWKAGQRYLPIHASSVFDRAFSTRPAVRSTVNAFLRFLLTDPETNRQTRQQINEFLELLLDEMVIYAGEMQSQPSGWSMDKRYDDLALPEKLWLDPERATLPGESVFAQEWQRMDWPEQVGRRFANWLNAQLQGKLPVGDAEARQWRRVLLADESWLLARGAA